MIRLLDSEWQLGQKIRGQSHDVFSLHLLGDYLISGGLTTDFCFYPLVSGAFEGTFLNRVSYCGTRRVSSGGRLLAVNKRDSFEIWSLGGNIHRTELMVRYEMTQGKFIIDCQLFPQFFQESTSLLIVVTD